MDNAKRIEALEKRVGDLEKAFTQTDNLDRNIVEIDLNLPEADINGLHFNEQKVHAVFEKKADGWYYSRDILFLSARNTEDGNGRDILTEYLNNYDFKTALLNALDNRLGIATDIKVSLPNGNEGVKQYNGVACWYWLADPSAGSAAYFCYVATNGHADYHDASVVGGCAPAFRVAERHG